ncbi:abortive infection family protein [Corynebacterium casei]|uniref:abortive infection family protein n=1 Tax=Corynebacterium casei TaxID=160386 RepID=UPI001867FC1F
MLALSSRLRTPDPEEPNKLVDGVKDLRTQESVAGHGLHVVPNIPRADAQLAVDASLAWCRYVIERFNRRQEEAVPPF